MQILGVDGCRGGWVAISAKHEGGEFAWHIVEQLRDLLSWGDSPKVIAVDIPIGLPDIGPRACDLEARKLLGRGRASSVFPAPIRPILSASSYAEANEARRVAEGKGLPKQAWAIVPKVREIDDALRADPDLRAVVREVHPEICFYFLAGRRPMRVSKKRADGRAQRSQLLRAHFGLVVDDALSELRGPDCAADDVLDSFAALWTAQRIARGEAVSLPTLPSRDRFGLPMEIVA